MPYVMPKSLRLILKDGDRLRIGSTILKLSYQDELEESFQLNPNDADTLVQHANCRAFLGEPEEGLELLEKALRLNPYHDSWYYAYGAMPYFVLRDYEKALEMASRAPSRAAGPSFPKSREEFAQDLAGERPGVDAFRFIPSPSVESVRRPSALALSIVSLC